MSVERLWIGQLAAQSGVSPEAIRYYEKVGVLPRPARTGSGYRVYGLQDLERLEFVGQAQVLGLRLDEIAEIMELADGGVQPCEHVRQRLRERLEDVERRIEELRGLQGRLESALGRAESSPAPRSCRCHIIEGIEEPAAREEAGQRRSGKKLRGQGTR